MTPKRKEALQWVYEAPMVRPTDFGWRNTPTVKMRREMIADGQIEYCTSRGAPSEHGMFLQLTDKGRQDLHEASQ